MTDEYLNYGIQVIKNAQTLSSELISKGFKVISGGTDNHSMLIDMRSKGITGKDAELALGKAHITVNKNMVPFDDKSPFITSGIRIGSAAITTRGLIENDCKEIVSWIDAAVQHADDDAFLIDLGKKVNEKMKQFPLFQW